jgi:hypothetical protein
MKTRLAWFSCLPGDAGSENSHSAWTSGILLPILRHWFDIELFHDSFDSYQDYTSHHYLSATTRDAKAPFDLFVYQLEDAKCSQFCRVHAVLKPGLLWFHDYLFTSFGPEPILNSNWQHAVAQFHETASDFSERGTEWTQVGPHACREGAYALAALFSNHAQLADFRARSQEFPRVSNGEPPVSFLPIPVPGIERYNGNPTQGRIAWCGSPRVEHRSHKVLGALALLLSDSPKRDSWYCTWLVDASEQELAQAEIDQYPALKPYITLETGRSPEAWSRLLLRSDIALHPYFSVFGQLSPYIQISMQRGMPLITTAFAGTDSCPGELVFKVKAGEFESQEMAQTIGALLTGGVKVPTHQLAAYATELFEPRAVALGLASFIEQSLPSASLIQSNWQEYETEARKALLTELEAVAPGANSKLDALLLPVRRVLTPLCAGDSWFGVAL